jgi:tRNA dimethylallyltransferase
LYGFQDAKKNFSTGDWLKLANQKILQCRKLNKTPILVGGTGLYFKALTEGLVNIPKIPINFRNKVRNLHKRIGQKKFFQKLLQIDPLIKDRINSLDVQRSLRAYEIKSFTKKSMISWFKNTKSDYDYNDFFKICIDFPRKDLIERINQRSENMVKLGAILEVKKFIKLRVPKNKSLSKAIGISEIKQYLQKKIQTEQLIEKISIKTRQYAKRQSTWARGHMKDWNKVSPAGLDKLLKKI